MNPPDDQLDRLFRAAATHQDMEIHSPAFGLETRVVAAWRSSLGGTMWDSTVLVRGLALASLIMVLSIWPAMTQKSANPAAEYLQLADSSVQTDFSP